MGSRRQAFLAVLLAVGGCRRAPAVRAIEDGVVLPSASAPQVADDDPEPTLSPEVRSSIAALSPASLPPPPPDASNRFADDEGARRLGQKLFYDKGFSGRLLDGDNDGSTHALGKKGESGKVACAGCHVSSAAFSDTRSVRRQISLGAGWGRRRAPSLLDVGQSRLLMWDGRRDTLYNQIFGPIESEVEMNSSRLYVAEQIFLRHRAEYEKIFGSLERMEKIARIAPLSADQTGCSKLDASAKCTEPMRGAPGDHAEFDRLDPADRHAATQVVVNAGKAIGAYERLLGCGQSRFDRWVHGDDGALGRAEQRGAALFVGKARCVPCHGGPFLSDEKFHNIGLRPKFVATAFLDDHDQGAFEALSLMKSDPLNIKGRFSDGNDGRADERSGPEATGAFRTPRLRCVSQRPSFSHTGQLRTLAEVVSFFDRGGETEGYPGHSEIHPLGLTPRERADVVAFLASLDGPGPQQELLGP